jgi:two-component system OmpR family sensor kinase
LRTPLTALQLQADILDGGRNADEKAARLADLRAGIRRVIRLSEQLLAIARSESEGEPITVTTELETTLAEVVALYRHPARAAKIDLQIQVVSGVKVYGNARRLTLIFGNLLDNALRYTPAGGHIRIHAGVEGGLARIQMWDEGCGLPAQDLERVFERFYRASDAAGDGNGLGLATVQTLVRQLGGHVILENRRDRTGLVATVTLPLVPQPPGSDAASASEALERDSTELARS